MSNVSVTQAASCCVRFWVFFFEFRVGRTAMSSAGDRTPGLRSADVAMSSYFARRAAVRGGRSVESCGTYPIIYPSEQLRTPSTNHCSRQDQYGVRPENLADITKTTTSNALLHTPVLHCLDAVPSCHFSSSRSRRRSIHTSKTWQWTRYTGAGN